MAYYAQRLLSIDPNSSFGPPQAHINYGDETIINKAVVRDALNPSLWLLTNENSIVDGAIIGFSYGQIQVAVDGWDIRFINGTTNPLLNNVRIIGSALPTGELGFVKNTPAVPGSFTPDTYHAILNGRGVVNDGGPANEAGEGIVRVAMRYGT